MLTKVRRLLAARHPDKRMLLHILEESGGRRLSEANEQEGGQTPQPDACIAAGETALL